MSVVKKLLTITTGLRDTHEKRSELRNYSESFNDMLILPSKKDCFKISIGYFERFLMKAEKEKIDDLSEDFILSITHWSEGCGYFEGKYAFLQEKNVIKEGSFSWEGVGKIAQSWNSFSHFE